VTEGPLKALKATQEGFPCVALNGIWGWRTKDPDNLDGPTIPIPDLDLIKWNGRDVVLVFDADLKPKTVENVRRAERALAQELADRGARVSIVRLPLATGATEKVGVDDYLVAFGAQGFAALPRAAPDQDDPGVDQAIKKVEQAADLAPWRYPADRKVLAYGLAFAWARQNLAVPMYVRSVSGMIDVPHSTVTAALGRLCLNGWLRRDPAATSYFHILEPGPLHSLLPKHESPAGGGSLVGGPPLLVGNREGDNVGRQTVGHDPEEGERGEGSRKVGPQTVPHSSKDPNWAGTARLLERAVPDAHRPRHDVWHPKALGPCLRTYRLLIGMGEASAKILAALEEKPVKTVLARLRRLRASGLAAFAGKWRPIRAPIEHFDDVARQFNVVGLRAHEKAAREALHRQERVTYRERNKGKKRTRPTKPILPREEP
jgi:Domain of unknown function (DUF3854)